MPGSLQQKRVLALEVFGSHLVHDSKKARGFCVKPWSLIPENARAVGMVGWPGLEPGTNPENFRGCSTTTGFAAMPAPAGDFSCVSSRAPRHAPRRASPFLLLPQPPNCHRYALSNKYGRGGVHGVGAPDQWLSRYNAAPHRHAECKPKPCNYLKKLVGWPGLEPGTNGLKGRCSTD